MFCAFSKIGDDGRDAIRIGGFVAAFIAIGGAGLVALVGLQSLGKKLYSYLFGELCDIMVFVGEAPETWSL